MNAMETRLQGRIDRRDLVQGMREALLAERGDGNLSDTDKKQIEMYREEIVELDQEIEQLADDLEAQNKAAETSKKLRRAMIGATDGVDSTEDGVIYRDFASFARDEILSRNGQTFAAIQQRLPKDEVEAARARLELLKRTPANTLSSDVGGLRPDQHIAQIMQVIDKSRPLVSSGRSSSLERGKLSFPKVTQRPVVAVQSAEKTEAGNQKMIVTMEEATASTYLGGGDLSWQAINWSTPDALQLWFDLAAADYALKTEQDAATVVSAAAFLNNVTSTLGATPTYAQFIAAIAAGAGQVYDESGRLSDAIYMAPDRFYYLAGLTTDVQSPFLNINLNLGAQSGDTSSLRLIVSRGLNPGEIAVGDSSALLVAETDGAPVELRAVEPAIGGLEVGIIGAFEAVVVEDGAFSLVTTAS